MTEVKQILDNAMKRSDGYLFEFECYDLFKAFGMKMPAYKYFPLAQKAQIKDFMEKGKKYIYKCHIPGCLHKTDIGGLAFNITKETADVEADKFIEKLKDKDLEGIIVVEMANFFKNTPS